MMDQKKKRTSSYIYLILMTIVLCNFLTGSLEYFPNKRDYTEKLNAALLMDESLKEIALLREELGIPFNPEVDPNHTGIMGEEFTLMTTSVGNQHFKRTGTNPNFAAIVVKLFKDAGLRAGDVVAISSSGSYPSLLLAALCAAKSLDLVPYITYSFGSSMYGSTLPEMTFPVMLDRLREKDILPYQFAAVSMGGKNDQGEPTNLTYLAEMFSEEGDQSRLLRKLCEDTGIFMIDIADTESNIQFRVAFFEELAGEEEIKCFVNVGGALYSYGFTSDSLNLSGLTKQYSPMPEDPLRGLTFEFLDKGIPVVNLLNTTGLAKGHGLPIDPVPLPAPGEGGIYNKKDFPLEWIIIGAIITFCYFFYNYIKNRRPRKLDRPKI